jgi:hypothetical protein
MNLYNDNKDTVVDISKSKLNIKWIEINNFTLPYNKMLYDMCIKYKNKFPNFLDLHPGEIYIINLTAYYSVLMLDMLSDNVETISINEQYVVNKTDNKHGSDKINIYITKKYPFLKNIIVNVENVNNMKDLAQYAIDCNVNLHIICNSKLNYTIETSI